MNKWMMKFQVEGHLGVDGSRGTLVFRHPSGEYEAHVENLDVAAGNERPLLAMFLVFGAEDIGAAADAGPRHLDRFLQFLIFATGARFRAVRPLCLYDWSENERSMRQGYVYQRFSDPNIPQLVMDEAVVGTVEMLLNSDGKDADVMKALDWFSSAVSAGRADEQFQFFWFCIETLARRSRDKAQVPDRCQLCREPLYCPVCRKVSTHRPYPSQAIEQLFGRFIDGDPVPPYRRASRMRHALLHGSGVTDLERELGVELGQMVDEVGRLAWLALLDGLLRMSGHKGKFNLRLIQPNTFVHYAQTLTVHLAAGFALGRTPLFTEIPKAVVTAQIVESPTQAPRQSLSPYVTRDNDENRLSGEQEVE